MHFVTFAAFFLDGLAFAAEALVGQAAGAANRAGLWAAARMTTWWAASVAVAGCGVFALLGSTVIDTLTVDAGVRTTARTYLPWAVMAPIVSVWAFQLDGIFIGATRTAQMRNAMLAALAIFLFAWWSLAPFGNHGLWAALYVLYAARAGTLSYCLPGLLRSVPA
jgi:MATE family multidrug resistance protein